MLQIECSTKLFTFLFPALLINTAESIIHLIKYIASNFESFDSC